jgi:D-arabinose 1-dehydrogenase-like Zn-dependent alcohol dehydrogenase
MTMPAVVLTADGRIALQDRLRPTLRPDQVLIEVDLCGICGSDLHASQLPQVYRGDCILGHESADWAIGHRVAVNPNGNVDGTCAYCRSGRPNFCPQATLETAPGLQADGALAR